MLRHVPQSQYFRISSPGVWPGVVKPEKVGFKAGVPGSVFPGDSYRSRGGRGRIFFYIIHCSREFYLNNERIGMIGQNNLPAQTKKNCPSTGNEYKKSSYF